MAQVALLTRIRVREGKAGEFLQSFQEVFTQAEKEPGTVLYVLNRAQDDPELFWVSEIYADEEALATHRGSAAMDVARAVFPELLAESEFLIGEPVSVKGVAGWESAE
ncbi:putative quinol monooxygenase [Nocardia sp. NPDC101769]|uniref:putative quinol monooxygenase n=1 Tax=Nocardia sp. NPDC101769 TaxID=3364333 RepID=UPI0038222F90